MDELLKTIVKKHGVDSELIEKILEIEKHNVYKKSRKISADLRELVENKINNEVRQNDN